MKRAFTLIELSIVLIIIGLLVGGILVGKTLVEQASIRAQINQLRNYEVAYNTFKVKYGVDSLPGDYDNAANVITGATSGDGDGIIEIASPANTVFSQPCHNTALAANTGEQGEFFLQLAAAGLVEGSYDGGLTLGDSYPELKVTDGVGMWVGGRVTIPGGGIYGDGGQILESQDPLKRAVLCLTMGDPVPSGLSTTSQNAARLLGVFSPEIASALDSKIDDGQPKAGKFIAIRPWASSQGNCTNASPYDAYNLTETRNSCQAMYVLERR